MPVANLGRSLRAISALLALGWLIALPSQAHGQACIEEAAGGQLQCTSNDVRIARAHADEITNDCTDADGKAVFDLVVEVVAGPNRYDIGAYFATEGDARTGTCEVVVAPTDVSPFTDLDVDACGDIAATTGGEFTAVEQIEVPCADLDGNRQLDLDSCLSWDNNSSDNKNPNDDCQGVEDAVPGTGAKCRCERINITNIPLCAGVTCNDGIACTNDTCDPQTGGCIFTPDDTKCGDGIECTADACDANAGCTNTPDDTQCGDGVACTVDACDARQGCLNTPDDTQCGDGVACTVDVCDAITGCESTPDDTQCSDGVACTVDDCDAITGCESTPDDTQCSDGVACTVDDCDAITGCENTPDDTQCDDENGCTADSCDPASGCVNDPIASDPNSATGDARAYGLSLVLLNTEVIEPQPDTDDTDPYEVGELPLDPLAHVDVLSGSTKSNIVSPNSAKTSAEARTVDVFLLDQSTGVGPIRLWTVIAKVIQTSSSSTATADGASSTGDCHLADVKIMTAPGVYQNIAEVKEPVSIPVVIPGLGTKVNVKLCEHIPSGAAAGEPQPGASGSTASGLIVNGIHVSSAAGALEPITGEVPIDLVVAHSESSAQFGTVCEDLADVSGKACAANLKIDEEIIDPDNQLLGADVGCVTLPSTGGNPPDTTLAKVGPLSSDAGLLLFANAASAHTEGTPSEGAQSHAHIADVDALAPAGGPPILAADLVSGDCAAFPNASSECAAEIVNLSLVGTNVIGEFCTQSGDQTLCHPPANTKLLPDGLPIQIILNEQIDTSTAEKAEITCNAIHVIGLGGDIPASLDLILSGTHCDVRKAPQ